MLSLVILTRIMSTRVKFAAMNPYKHAYPLDSLRLHPTHQPTRQQIKIEPSRPGVRRKAFA